MLTNQNSGHAKNVDNLYRFIQAAKAMGTAYKPSNTLLTIASLETLHTKASGLLTDIKTNFTGWQDATNAREIAFQGLDKFCHRIGAAVKSTGAPPQSYRDVKALVDAIASGSKLTKADAGRSSGGNATGTPAPDPASGTQTPPAEPAAHTRHVGFDEKINYFDQLVVVLENQPTYTPNEAELSTADLRIKHAALDGANKAVIAAEVELSNSRNTRNTLFYAEATGLVDLMQKAKEYVKSLQGNRSQLYKSVSGLRFKRVVASKDSI